MLAFVNCGDAAATAAIEAAAGTSFACTDAGAGTAPPPTGGEVTEVGLLSAAAAAGVEEGAGTEEAVDGVGGLLLELLTAEAAAAEYRMGGSTAGVDLAGAGEAPLVEIAEGVASLVGVDTVGTPLAEREGPPKPVGRCAVPSSVAFLALLAVVVVVFVAVGLRSPLL